MAKERTASPPPAANLRVRFNQFELDEADARLTRAGEPVPLAPKPFAVLCALARSPQALITKNTLLDTVWGHRFVTESVLKSTISELRAALQDDPKQPRYIETVSRRGYRFIAAVNRPAALPMTAAPSAMIGRAQPLERLRAAWQRAAAGQRQIVWLAGEAGVGKTTLGERFMAEVGDAYVIHGQCVEQFGAGEPYLPVLEALTALCRRDAAAPELIRSVAPTWLLQLPWLTTPAERDALRREVAGGGQARMLREIGEFLDRYTQNRPLLLVTADLHWGDAATVQLMDYIARRRAATRLLWLASFRLTEIVAGEHPLRTVRNELRLHGLAEEIVLDPFSEQEVAEYVAQHLPARAGDEAFARALHARTDGLPLFVADVANEVAARGKVPDSLAIPGSLSGIVERYIAQLSPLERVLLEAASVCGSAFRPATVAELLGRDVASVIESCAELARQQRWLNEADDGYAFRHALYREVLYKRIATLARVDLHRRLGAVLERERAAGGSLSALELASHFELGREPMAALRHYVEAAQSALAQLVAEECVRITERALPLVDLAPAGPERDALDVSLHTLRGLAATRALGAGVQAKDALLRARGLLDRVPDHPMRRRLVHGLGYTHFLRAEYAEALAVADGAEALGSATDDPALLYTAWALRGQVGHHQGRPLLARDALQRAVPHAERFDVSAGEYLVDPHAALFCAVSIPLLHLGFVDEARASLRRAHARARERGFPMAHLSALWHEALLELRLGDAKRVGEIAIEMHGLVDKFALAHGQTAWRWFRAWADARLGKPAGAHRAIREAYEENMRLGMLAGTSEVLGYAAEALLLAGDAAGAEKELTEALRYADDLGERMYRVQLELLAARIAQTRGDLDRAREAAGRARAEARAQQAPWLEKIAHS